MKLRAIEKKDDGLFYKENTLKLFTMLIMLVLPLALSAAENPYLVTIDVLDKKSFTERFYSLTLSNDNALPAYVEWGARNSKAEQPFSFFYRETWRISSEQKNTIIELHKTEKIDALATLLYTLADDPTVRITSETVEDHVATPY